MIESIKLNLQQRSLWFFIIVAALIILLWIPGEYSIELLNYQRSAVSNGEYWRLITGHLVHSNIWHLLLNLASLTMIGLLFSQHLSIKLWSTVFILSAIIISGCYYFIAPEYERYVGLSAVLYSVIIIGALHDLKQQTLVAMLILIVVTGRVIWQQYHGSVDSLAELIGDRVAIESHLFGISTGYLIGLTLLTWNHFHKRS